MDAVTPAPAAQPAHTLGPERCPVCTSGERPVRAREVAGDQAEPTPQRVTEVVVR